MSGRPIDPNTGDKIPLNEKGRPEDPISHTIYPGEFDKATGRAVNPKTGQPIPPSFDENTGIPLDRDGKPYPIDPVKCRPIDPQTQQELPGVFDPKSLIPLDPETMEQLDAPCKFDPVSGRPLDPVTGQPVPIHPSSFAPTDPETGKRYPGTFDPQTGQPIDPYSLEPLMARFHPMNGQPLDPISQKPIPIDPKSGRPVDPKTGELQPGCFDPKTGRPVDPATGEQCFQPTVHKPQDAQATIPSRQPEEEERVTGITFNPDTGRPIGPDGNELPLNSKGNPEVPHSKQVLPMTFDKETGRLVNPETGKPVPPNYDAFTGRPIDPATGKPFPIDEQTLRPIDPTGESNLPGMFEPKTGLPIDPETGESFPESYDSKTGRPINPITARPFPIDPASKQPVDPRTGEKLPGQFDPETGRPVVQPTGEVSQHDRFDPVTGRPVDPSTGELYPLNAKGIPVNPRTNKPLPGKFDPKDGLPIDPATGSKPPPKFDPATGMPIDPATKQPYPLDQNGFPYDPIAQKKLPGRFDPLTGRPINPDTMEAIPDKFDNKTGRPIDPLTGKPFPLNAKGEPVDEARGGKKLPSPLKFDPKSGLPVDPVTKKPIPLNKPIKPEEMERKNPNEINHYHGRKFNPTVAPSHDNDGNNFKPRPRAPSEDEKKPQQEERAIGKLKPKDQSPAEEDRPLNKTGKLNLKPSTTEPVPPAKEKKAPTKLTAAPATIPEKPEDAQDPKPIDPSEQEQKTEFGPQDLMNQIPPIPPQESGRDLILSFAEIWAKNPDAAEAFCTKETFQTLNNVLEEVKKPSHSEEERKATEDKVYSMITNLINCLPAEEEKQIEIMKPLEPKNILPIISDKIETIPALPENPEENPIVRMKTVENAEEILDVLEKVWNASPDKGPFVAERIPEKLLDKINELNRLGPDEAEKSGVNDTLVAGLAQAVHPMLMEASTAKAAVAHGAVPILSESMEILEEAMPKKNFEENIPVKGADINKDLPFSPHPIEAALESVCVAFKDLTENKKVAAGLPIDPEEEENTFKLLETVLKNHPEDPIVVSKTTEAMSNILKNQKVEDLMPIAPYLEELHQDMMKLHKAYPTNPYVEELLQSIKDKVDDIKAEEAKQAVAIPPVFEEEERAATAAAKPVPQTVPQLSAAPEEDLRDLGFLNDNLDNITEAAQTRPLEPAEEENLRTILENIQNIKAIDPETAESTSANLKIPEKLADIASNPNIPPEMAQKSVETLASILENPEVLAKVAQEAEVQEKLMEAFVMLAHKSQEPDFEEREALLEAIGNTIKDMSQNSNALDSIRQNPEFMECLMDQFKKDPEDEAIGEITLGIMEELTKDEDLINIFADPEGPSALEDLYRKECDILPILRRTARVTGNMAKDFPSRSKLADEGSINFMNWGIGLYPTDLPLNINTAWAVRRLARHHPDNARKILDSGILKPISKCLGKHIDCNELAEHACHAVVNITFNNNQNKLDIENFEFLEKVCKCFDHYSKEKDLCQKNVLAALKALANLTVMPQHCHTVADIGTVKEFCDYFDRHQEPLRSQIMLGVVGNLGYEYNVPVLKQIIDQGAIQLIADSVTHFNKLDEVPTLLCAVDALGTIAHNKEICKVISNYVIVPPVVKMLKGQDYNKDLVYKTTRCLYRICVYEGLKEEAIQKKAHEVTADIIDKYFKDDPILFNAFRLMNTLISIDDKETIQDTHDTGLIGKVVKQFYDQLATPICSEVFQTFCKMCCLEPPCDELGRTFSKKLNQLIDERIKDKDFMKPAMDLLNELSMLPSNIDPLYVHETIPLTKKVMESYEHDPNIQVPNLQVIAEFAKDSEQMRQECLNEKLDDQTDKLIESIDECMEPLYMSEAKTVQMLLRGEDLLKKKKGKDKMGLDDNETMELPIEVIQFLTAGRTMELYGEDGQKRTFHFFMTKDLKEVICKRPNERKAKQKWLMPVSGVKDITKGYDKAANSPFEKGTGFFTKSPEPASCFSIFGPTTDSGNQNFHFKCENQTQRDKWVDYMNMVRKYAKVMAKSNLKKRKEFENDD